MQLERLQSQQVYFFSTEVVHSNMTGGRGGSRVVWPAVSAASSVRNRRRCQVLLYCLLLLIMGDPRGQNDALRADGMCTPRGEGASERVEKQKGSAMKAASPKIKSKAPWGGCECKKEKSVGAGGVKEEGASGDGMAKKREWTCK